MKIIKVNLNSRSYNIHIGSSILKNLGVILRKLNLGTHAYIITNSAIKKHHAEKLQKSLKSAGIENKIRLITDSETSKSLNTAYAVIKDLAGYEEKKKVFVIAFGGGVVGDLAGFVASIYKRGIPYVQIPTTLLAQVDSAIGGKTAVDLAAGKNLVGAFYQPKLVLSDTSLLKTLNKKQILSGLSETIKYGAIKDAALFNYLERNYKKVIAKDSRALESIVEAASAIKAKITQLDEREEKGLRTILNFGHTIGHAIEAAAKFKRYSHGEAVGLGMLVAIDIGGLLKITDEDTYKRIEKLIKVTGLPIKIKGVSFKNIVKAHYLDKKFSGGKNKFVIVEKIGKVKIIKNIPLKIIQQAIKSRLS